MATRKSRYRKDLQWWVINRTEMVLGYVWVILWFSWTLLPYVEAIRQTGALDKKFVSYRPFFQR
jgi:hypothetical protein